MADAETLPDDLRILVLGGYGFIGAELVRACLREGHYVRALGRDQARAKPGCDWITGDLTQMQSAGDWHGALDEINVVINAVGSLQDGAKDTLGAVHHGAVAALGEAAAKSGVRIVQISAAGAAPAASTAFLSSKGAGDAALLASGAEAIVLRPGLVLARSVYGGTALLRMLAAVPWVQPLAMPGARVQIIGMDDLTDAVLAAARGEVASGGTYDLLAEEVVTLADLVGHVRAWLGFAPARGAIALPRWLAHAVAKAADGLGWLGWRSPLRSTALRVLEDGVTGDPAPWREATGRTMAPLPAVLEATPATLQDRWHARLYLLMPVFVAGLAAFWIASGLVGAAQWRPAVTLLGFAGFGIDEAKLFVFGGALADIALGAALLVRPWARAACLGMIALSLGYLGASAIWTPWLWLDPLGPMVKVIPGILLAAGLHALLEER